MKTATLQGQFSLKCLDPRIEDALIIDKKKILIGSSDKCDFKLNDKSVSSMHAFLCLKGEGFMVKDLYSEGGVFVNGRRVDEASVFPGDTLTIGTLSFAIEGLEENVPVFNPDEAIVSVQTPASVELPPRPGLIFIDGEYCDIEFDDSNFKPLTEIPKVSVNGEFIDLDQTEEVLDIGYSVKDKRLEIISYVNGLMMDVSYLSLKNGDYSFNSQKKKKTDILFHTLNNTKIFSIQNGELKFYASEAVTPSTDWDKINLNDTVFFSHGTEQVSFRLVDHTTGWRGIPAFYRDREFFKQGGKVFASVFLPLLVLLFITVPHQEEFKEEIAVVYKLPEKVVKPQESQEKSELTAEQLTSKTENTGHKETEQPNQKVEFAAASQNKKVQAKAAAPTPAAAQPVQTTPVKSYEFKSSVAFNSLVGDAPKINTNGSTAKGAVKDTTFNSGTSDNGQLVAGANIGVSKFNGSDKSGSGSGSYGSRGLASKSGFDSSYLEPKTVVLGSMDPELLRKILREYIPQFRHCYQQELIANSDKIKGVIDLNFTISAGGKVSKYAIKVKDAQFSKKGVGCMGQVLSLIEFPKPKGGGVVDVRQPLNFFSETEKI
ncbi:AgmX/PglI C-terminal domain-containing protein [Peredibacter sp. HCB2-198]|uniref:AgmX/PglI C-terminal domain-containing protein n=1 Tax=Peredibacter sp. HCB2-198 TaxID=3383025 RepID=UPI0038B68E21